MQGFPWWLSLLIAPLNLSPILNAAVYAAYLLWKELPVIEKIIESIHFTHAVASAAALDHTRPLQDFTDKLSDRVK